MHRMMAKQADAVTSSGEESQEMSTKTLEFPDTRNMPFEAGAPTVTDCPSLLWSIEVKGAVYQDLAAINTTGVWLRQSPPQG
jgi:hypothetical protein